jgi:hypothetical protein
MVSELRKLGDFLPFRVLLENGSMDKGACRQRTADLERNRFAAGIGLFY